MCETFNGPPVWYRETQQRARKEYVCIECRRPIPVGAEYTYGVGQWDEPEQDKISVFRTCRACAADRRELEEWKGKELNENYTVPFGGLKDCIEESVSEEETVPRHHRLAVKWMGDAARLTCTTGTEHQGERWCIECGKTLRAGAVAFEAHCEAGQRCTLCTACNNDRILLATWLAAWGLRDDMPQVGKLDSCVEALVETGTITDDHLLVRRRRGEEVPMWEYPVDAPTQCFFPFMERT